jgi:hypothetical protein
MVISVSLNRFVSPGDTIKSSKSVRGVAGAPNVGLTERQPSVEANITTNRENRAAFFISQLPYLDVFIREEVIDIYFFLQRLEVLIFSLSITKNIIMQEIIILVTKSVTVFD